jgi:hypothetical protein
VDRLPLLVLADLRELAAQAVEHAVHLVNGNHHGVCGLCNAMCRRNLAPGLVVRVLDVLLDVR